MKNLILAITLLAITIAAVILYPSVHANIADRAVITSLPMAKPPSVIVPVSNPFATPQGQPQIEVVFVLDTTGSMSGLIQGAKDNIWSIASSMASAQPAPIIKMGLVAYRDRGDDYVTKIVDLTDDLDTSYGALMGFHANGGGDTPESVNKGLFDAVTGMSWSQDDSTYRVIFLVGDAPPKMSYQDEMQYPEIVKLAQSKGIVINAIQVGSMATTTQSWQQIAQAGQGEFFQVDQSGGAVAVVSPYDEQIASLARELDETRLFYGSSEIKENRRAKTAAAKKFNLEGSITSVARKAEFNISESGARNFAGDNELIADVLGGRIQLGTIAERELPEELQTLSSKDRQALVNQKAHQREEVKKQIAELSKKRSDYLKVELAKTEADENSLDNKIYQAVKAQTRDRGLVYSEAAPKY